MRRSLQRIAAIARKEFTHIRRDWRLVVSVLVLPAAMLLLFAYAISFDVKNVPTVIIDQDHTAQSEAYVRAYSASDFFRVAGTLPTVDAIDQAFDTNIARIAVVVPPGFGRAITSGQRASVGVFVDGSEPNSAQLGQTYANALNQTYGRTVLAMWAEAKGLSLAGQGSVEPRIRLWYNPERSSANFLVPGLMVVIIMIVTMQQTAVTLVREEEQGTRDQMLVSPLRQWELMAGKLLPWAILAFADMFAIIALGLLVFHVPLRGSVPFLALSTGVFVLCALGLGLVISAIAPSTESANIMAILVSFLPGFMLSGFAFDLASIPRALQVVSYAFPGRYMTVIARGVFLKGAGFAELWGQLALLCVYALVVITVASVLFGRRRA